MGTKRRTMGSDQGVCAGTKRRDEKRIYRGKPGGGRKPIDPRLVPEGIFHVLRTGIQWKALPKEYGSASGIHQYFSEM
jgi:transposase